MAWKSTVIGCVTQKLETELAALLIAARAAHEAATHEESKPEDQYDTRGLEASYLAGAQARRAEEIQASLAYFRGGAAQDTQLVAAQCEGRTQHYLVARRGGGVSVVVEGRNIQVITPDSPIGAELGGRRAGEEIEIEVRDDVRTYRVLSVE